MIKVRNIISDSSGKAIANQFIIRDNVRNITCFQSYDSIIVKRVKGKVYLDKNKWDYSRTTGKYRNEFIGETKRATEKRIKSGQYKLVDLNK